MSATGSLEDVLASLTPTTYAGHVHRVMLNDYPPQRENTLGARWNPLDVRAIYTCLEPAVCIAEVEYNLRRQPRPTKTTLRKTLYTIDVCVSAVVDLTASLSALEELGIGFAELFADDMKASQEIGRLVTWLEYGGLIVPSARASGKNLVIYPGRLTEDFRFEVVEQREL